MDIQLLLTAAVVALTIGLWATAKLPEYLTALLFFAAAMLLQLAPPALIFSGFASGAFWLVLSGFVLGLAIQQTGLADRCARALASRLSGSYVQMVFGVIGLCYALALVMPSSMGRIALLMPIVLALAERTGLVEGRRGRLGLALAVGVATFQLSCSILPANVPNLVMVGAIESSYGLHLSYLSYLMLHGPVLGLLKALALGGSVCVLFADRLDRRAEPESGPPLSRDEKRLALLLAITVGLWVSDSLHGISPAWIGLLAACICLLPRIGFVSAEAFGSKVNHRTALYVAAILGLAALVGQSGLGRMIGDALLAWLPLDPATPLRSFLSIVGLSSVLNFVVTANGVPAMFTPMAQSLVDASGFPLLGVLMIQVIGFATPLLPYQAPPIIVAMALGKVPLRHALRLCLALAALTFVLLVPLDYLWFSLLGWLG